MSYKIGTKSGSTTIDEGYNKYTSSGGPNVDYSKFATSARENITKIRSGQNTPETFGATKEQIKESRDFYNTFATNSSKFKSSLDKHAGLLNAVIAQTSRYSTPITNQIASSIQLSGEPKKILLDLIKSSGTAGIDPGTIQGFKTFTDNAVIEFQDYSQVFRSAVDHYNILLNSGGDLPAEPPPRPSASPDIPPAPGSGGGGGGGSTPPTPGEDDPAPGSSEADTGEEFKLQLRGIVDSDQCKISRMYNFFETYFFENKYPSSYSNSYSSPASQQYQLFDYIKPQDKKKGINPSILTRNKAEVMHAWYMNTILISKFNKNVSFFKVYREKTQSGFTGNFTNIVPITFPRTSADAGVNVPGVLNQSNPATSNALDAALVSFECSYVGTDSFTAEKDIEATAEILMNSLDALFEERQPAGGTGSNFRLSDLIIQPSCFLNETPIDPSASETEIPQVRYSLQEAGRPWVPECYEIMVNLENNISNETLQSTTTGGSSWTDENLLKYVNWNPEGVDKFKQTLFLTLVDHKLDFMPTGQVRLTINYRARLGSTMRSTVLDVNSPSGELNVEQTQELKKILGVDTNERGGILDGTLDLYDGNSAATEIAMTLPYAASQLGSLIGITSPTGFSQGDYDRVNDLSLLYRKLEERKLQIQGVEASKKELKLVNDALSYLRKIGTKKFFNNVLSHLLKNDRVEILRLENAIKTKNYIQNPTTANLMQSIQELQTLMSQGVNPIQNSDSDPTLESVTDIEEQRSLLRTQVQGEATKANTEGDDANISETNGSVKGTPKDISFVFFYDLIHSVIQTLIQRDKTGQAEELLKTFYILHSSLLMPDYSSGFSADKKTWMPFNIAATPIAISTLNNFVANLAEQDREKYPLFALLRDMVNQLLADALGSECVDKYNSPTFIQKFLQINDYSGDISKIDQFSSLSSGKPTTGGFVDGKNLAKSFKDYYSPIRISQAQAGQTTFARPIELMAISFENTTYSDVATGNFLIDNTNGIPHIKFKDKNGLVKTISLSKTDQPFLREARYAENSGYSLTQMSNVYDIQISMVGNNLLMLGGLIYFDPKTLGNNIGSPKNPQSLSSIMGIGGLYVVTKIQHNWNSSGFTTNATARYVSRGAI